MKSLDKAIALDPESAFMYEYRAELKDKNSFYYYLKSVIYKELCNGASAEENLNMAKSTLKENETMENMIRIIEDDYQIKFN